MYIADEENASDSFAFHNYLDERDKYQHNRFISMQYFSTLKNMNK